MRGGFASHQPLCLRWLPVFPKIVFMLAAQIWYKERNIVFGPAFQSDQRIIFTLGGGESWSWELSLSTML